MEAGSDKNVEWVTFKEPGVGQCLERGDRTTCEQLEEKKASQDDSRGFPASR